MRVSAKARYLFAVFRALPGSEQVATSYAIEGLLRWLRRRRPQHLYEAGAGLGTLSAAILTTAPVDNASFRYQLEERHVECRALWERRLGPLVGTDIVRTPDWTPPPRPFDFVVVDGPHGPYWHHLAPRAIVFFEGNRVTERADLASALRRRRRVAWANWRPLDRSKGFWVAHLDPTRLESCRFALVRWREWGLDRLICPWTGRWPGWRRRDRGGAEA